MVTKYNTGQCCVAHLPVTIVSAEQHAGKIEYNVEIGGKPLRQTVPEELLELTALNEDQIGIEMPA